jgi:hypothetical protein
MYLMGASYLHQSLGESLTRHHPKWQSEIFVRREKMTEVAHRWNTIIKKKDAIFLYTATRVDRY